MVRNCKYSENGLCLVTDFEIDVTHLDSLLAASSPYPPPKPDGPSLPPSSQSSAPPPPVPPPAPGTYLLFKPDFISLHPVIFFVIGFCPFFLVSFGHLRIFNLHYFVSRHIITHLISHNFISRFDCFLWLLSLYFMHL